MKTFYFVDLNCVNESDKKKLMKNTVWETQLEIFALCKECKLFKLTR